MMNIIVVFFPCFTSQVRYFNTITHLVRTCGNKKKLFFPASVSFAEIFWFFPGAHSVDLTAFCSFILVSFLKAPYFF